MSTIRQDVSSHLNVVLKKTVFAVPLCLLPFAAMPAGAAPACVTLPTPIYQIVNPKTLQSLLTHNQNEVIKAATNLGFTQSKGTPFSASLTPAEGLVPAYRMQSSINNDFIWLTSSGEIESAKKFGYSLPKPDPSFYVSLTPAPAHCTQPEHRLQPVYRFLKNGFHRYAVGEVEMKALKDSGWQLEGTGAQKDGPRFYAGLHPNARPGAINTGVPPWVQLTEIDSATIQRVGKINGQGVLVIDKNGAEIDGKDIGYPIRIDATNVVIRNSRIRGLNRGMDVPNDVNGSFLVIVNDGASAIIQDSELHPVIVSKYINGIGGKNYTLERVNIHGVVDQASISGDNVLIRDSWLHDNLWYAVVDNQKDGSHSDNVQIEKGANIRLINNVMDAGNDEEGKVNNRENATASIIVTQNQGAVTNLTIQGNYLASGRAFPGGPDEPSKCRINLLKEPQRPEGKKGPVIIKDNVFLRGNCAVGIHKSYDPDISKSVLNGNNFWQDGSPIEKVYTPQ